MGDSDLLLGIDLGGTKTAVVLLDSDGNAVRSARKRTEAQGGAEAVVSKTLDWLDRQGFVGLEAASAVGVGVAGQVDPDSGTVLHAPNLGWNDFPLGQRLRDALSLPTFVLNDVQAATVGEWRYGAARGEDHVVCMFLGTGLGGGVVSNGELVRGCGGSAGELGHITVELNGPRCSCGRRGCLEALVGGWAIARRARELVADDPESGLLSLAGGDPEEITAETVAEAFRAGDPLARQLVSEVGAALAAGAGSIANSLNPCVLVLGGGVIEGIPELVELVRDGIEERALDAALRELEIVEARLGVLAPAIGAATWARVRSGKGA